MFQEVADAHPPEVVTESLCVALEFLVPLVDDTEHGEFLFSNFGEKLPSALLADSPTKKVKDAKDANSKRKAAAARAGAPQTDEADAAEDETPAKKEKEEQLCQWQGPQEQAQTREPQLLNVNKRWV